MLDIKILFLKPYFATKIWGGKRLFEYGYELPSDKTGEALIISALKNMSSIVLNDGLNNISLYDFFNENKHLFGDYPNEYPLLTKIIDANDKLSVQVHPDNEYAKKKHNCLGKTECWYILDAEEDAELVYGLKTNSVQETKELIEQKEWDRLLNRIKVKKGDFVYVPSGMVHAIGKGILIYELQQSSDITYRLYDYDRLENGKYRDLHIEDSLNVIKYEFPKQEKEDVILIDNDFFNLKHIAINNSEYDIDSKDKYWTEVTVISGFGSVNNIPIKKGSSFILTHGHEAKIEGSVELLISYPK